MAWRRVPTPTCPVEAEAALSVYKGRWPSYDDEKFEVVGIRHLPDMLHGGEDYHYIPAYPNGEWDVVRPLTEDLAMSGCVRFVLVAKKPSKDVFEIKARPGVVGKYFLAYQALEFLLEDSSLTTCSRNGHKSAMWKDVTPNYRITIEEIND